MSRSAREGFIRHLEEQAEIKARERYWEKIFANAPDKSMDKIVSK